MRTIVLLAVLSNAVAGFGQTPVPAVAKQEPAIDVAVREIAEAWDRHQSLSLRVHALVPTPNAARSVELSGTIRVLKKDGKELYHRDTTTKTTLGSGEAIHVELLNVLEVSDGTTAHMIRNLGIQTRVFKIDPTKVQRVAGAPLVAQLRAFGDVTLVPPPASESVDYFVLKVKLRAPAPPADTLHVHINRDSGVMTKQIMYDTEGAEIQTLGFSDFKLDVPIDPRIFDFVPPAGVELIDQTAATKDRAKSEQESEPRP